MRRLGQSHHIERIQGTVRWYNGSRFDLATDAVLNGPAVTPLRVYDMQEVDGTVRIRA